MTTMHGENLNGDAPSGDDDNDWRLHFMVVLGIGLLALAVSFMLRPARITGEYGQEAKTASQSNTNATTTTQLNPANKDDARQ